MDIDKIAFQGELMLLQWSESSTRGRTATFLMNEEGESHPFRDFTIKSGKRSGQRFMVVMVQVDDDEQLVTQEKTLSQHAFLLCRDPEFWNWAGARSFDRIVDEASARAYICTSIGIKSRSEIDRDPAAGVAFQKHIQAPYEEHRKTAVLL